MDWESAKTHCAKKNWQWSLDFIIEAEAEMKDLKARLKDCEDLHKAQRLYNSCNY